MVALSRWRGAWRGAWRDARLGGAVLLILLATAPAAHAQQTPTPQTPAQQTPAPRTITFDDATRLALDNNFGLRQAANAVEADAIGVSRNRAEFLPDLRISANGGQRYGRDFVVDEGDFVNETSELASFGASAGVNLFNGFRDDATLDQAQRLVEASSRTLQRRRQDVVFDVMRRFIELAQNREIVRVQEENVALREQQLEQTEALIDVGERPPSDIYQQQAAVAEAEQALLDAQRNVQVTETELVRLLALDPMETYEFEAQRVERFAEAELDPGSYELPALLQQATGERADLRAQEATIAASEQSVRAARADYYPRLDLSGNYGSNWSSLGSIGGAGREPFFDQLDNRRSGSVSLSLSFPLFDRFQRRYGVDQAQVQVENARFEKEALRRDVAVEVQQAVLDYQNARKALSVTETRLEAARQAQRAAEERYNLGAATYVELAQASTDLVSAASERVRARYDFLFQKKRIDYATGTLQPEQPSFE